MVLGGARVERWLEAVDLFKEGWAPAMVISPGSSLRWKWSFSRKASAIHERETSRAMRCSRSESPPPRSPSFRAA